VTLPGGSEFPVFLKEDVELQAGIPFIRTYINQYVPAAAPAGNYAYNAYVKDALTWEILSSDSFPFEKVAGDGIPNHGHGWDVYGWDNEVAPSAEPVKEYALHPAVPNPFNPETTISYSLPEPGIISLRVYDVLGREAAVLYDGYASAGTHEVTWNAEGLSSGIYLIKLKTTESQIIERVLLVK